MRRDLLDSIREASEEETLGNSDDGSVYDDDDFEGFTFLQGDFICSNQDKATNILKSRILLDSQSTIDIFSNVRL